MQKGERLERTIEGATWPGSGLPDGDVALARLFEQETPWLEGVVRSIVRGSIAGVGPEDILQDCWLALIQKRQQVNFDSRRALRSWLRSTARNCWLNRQRRQQEVLESMDGVVDQPIESNSLGLCDVQRRRRALPFRQDASILLRDHCGCSYEVIALLLSCPSADAARGLHSRALESLLR